MSALAQAAASGGRGELCVFFRCHGFVFAVAARAVGRLVLTDDATASNEVDEHPAVKGFLELDEPGRPPITVLDPVVLMARFERLKFR